MNNTQIFKVLIALKINNLLLFLISCADKATSSNRVKHEAETHALPYFRDKLREQDRIQRLYGEKRNDTRNCNRKAKEMLRDKERYRIESTRRQNRVKSTRKQSPVESTRRQSRVKSTRRQSRVESTRKQSCMESTRRQNQKQKNPQANTVPRIVYVHVPVHVFIPNPFMRFPIPIFPPVHHPHTPGNPHISRTVNRYNFPNYSGRFYRN